jgi:hypothetical protein
LLFPKEKAIWPLTPVSVPVPVPVREDCLDSVDACVQPLVLAIVPRIQEGDVSAIEFDPSEEGTDPSLKDE